ncbi:hypothetical protein CLF_101346, partial [Clonorchis sinensis]
MLAVVMAVRRVCVEGSEGASAAQVSVSCLGVIERSFHLHGFFRPVGAWYPGRVTPVFPDRPVPALRPPNIFSSGDDFTLWSFRARSYLKLVPPSHTTATVDRYINRSAISHPVGDSGRSFQRQAANSAPARFRERKQPPGESVGQFLGSLRNLATKIYAAKNRIKIEEQLLQQFILGVFHPGLKAELIRRSPDNIRDAIQLARSYEATSVLEPQLHALKLNRKSRSPSAIT